MRRVAVRLSFALLALLPLLAAPTAARADPAAFVWVEGEAPAAADPAFQPSGGAAGILSGERWLALPQTQEGKAPPIPPGGFRLRYDVRVPQDGQYEVWARVGFERARPPVEWRVGDGAWARSEPEAHTTNVMRLGLWMEVAWLRLGTATLRAGATTLEFRYPEAAQGGRLLAALDCAALTLGPWVPEGRLKPGESYDGEADRAAAANVFRVPAAPAAPGARVELALNGAWQVARYDDPNMDAGPSEPVQALPTPAEYPLRWMGVTVPSNAWQKPELHFGHRILYRTRLDVPAGLRGRSFVLHFSGTNWIVSVFANGELMGTHKGVLIPWDQDVTAGIRPGQTNEIVVAVKGPWYAFDTETLKSTLEQERNRPNDSDRLRWARWVAPIYPSTKGEGDGTAYGLVNPVKLVVAGPAYVADVFVRTSVAKKRLDADVTLTNPGAAARTLKVQCAAVYTRTGAVEQTFPTVAVTVPAGGSKQVAVGGAWANPRLWWPVENPDLYALRTTVQEGARAVDVHHQRFGFREITLDGPRYRLNGVIRSFWNWVEVSGDPSTPEEFLKAFRSEGNRYYRFAHDSMVRQWFPYREAQLDFFDRGGIPGRLSTCIDGMFINYNLRNPKVWEAFGEHLEQMAKAWRNHPSVLFYSVENELLYINGQNVYGSLMDEIEGRAKEIINRARAFDNTRPYMVDGGGALKDDSLEVNCYHYPEAPLDHYPDNAYTFDAIADHSSRWSWKRDRPVVMGETFFYAGKLESQAWIGGDRVFRGRDEANKGASEYAQLLVEGYRWQGVTGICPWVALQKLPGAHDCFNDLAAFTRKRAHRFYAGSMASVLVKVLNDTLSHDPVQFEWMVEVGGKRIAGQTETLKIEAGTGQERALRFTPPASTQRQEGTLLLRVSQNGKLGYEARKPVVILPRVASINAAAPVLVFDRSGRVAAFLQERGVAFTAVADPAGLKGKSGLLVVGPDTLTADEAYGPALLGFAAAGGRAIVLEQETPLSGAGLPAPVRTTPRFGGYAFAQALGTPVFANLRPGDLVDWAGDPPTYKKAYQKPAGGARSLVECGDGLNLSALFEAPCGDGVLVAVQLRVGAKLGQEPAADHLLKNLMEHYGGYRSPQGVVAVLAPADSPVDRALAQTGVRVERVEDLRQALDPAKYRVAVIPATAANVAALEKASALLTAFTGPPNPPKPGGATGETNPPGFGGAGGAGWVMLWGLERDGLDAFNRLTGADQQIRPFRVERVTLEAGESPLVATLGNRDFTFYDSKPLMHGDFWLSGDVYTTVVGAGDAAPFCKMPAGPDDPFVYQPTFDDKDPYNFVNGMLNSDFWRYIRQIWVPDTGAEALVFGFRRPETIRQVNLWNNANYLTIQNLDIIIDGDTQNPVRTVLPAHGGIHEVKLDPPRRVEKSITLQIRDFRGTPRVRDGQPLRLVGLDNVQFLRVPPEGYGTYVQPLDNIGGLVAYPRGKGGLLLNQVKVMEQETVPANAGRKVRLVATLLQNMGAAMRSSSAVLVPGLNVQFTPLDLTRFCNRHLQLREGQPGWFGDRNRDLRHFTVGDQFLADVLYHVSDYATAPVPQVVMLGGPQSGGETRDLPEQVEGIAVGRKADALFFLHAARVRNPVRDDERRRRGFALPEVMKYVVHYADGATAEVPVVLEEHVDHWLQKEPRSLPGARAAWSVPFEGAAPDAERPVLYSMAWSNPRPDVAIATVDVAYGKDGRRATPAVLAISVGSRK